MSNLQTIYKFLFEAYKEESWDNSDDNMSTSLQDEMKYSYSSLFGKITEDDIKELIKRNSISAYIPFKKNCPSFTITDFKEILSRFSDNLEFFAERNLRIFKSINDFTNIIDSLGIDYDIFHIPASSVQGQITDIKFFVIPLYKKFDNVSHFVFQCIDSEVFPHGEFGVVIRFGYLLSSKQKEAFQSKEDLLVWINNKIRTTLGDYEYLSETDKIVFITKTIVDIISDNMPADGSISMYDEIEKMPQDYQNLLDVYFIDFDEDYNELVHTLKLCVKYQTPERISQ